jgi:DNA replication and repair protein RecF
VHIQWLEVADFRNYRSLSYEPAPFLNILTGPNAQGKTNLLESLAVLLVGRSPRGARPAEMARWDTEGASVVGELRRGAASRVVRRQVAPREDGTWSVTGEGCSWARAVPFGWHDLGIVTGTPQARRHYVDGFAGKIYPAHLSAVARYRQVVARRNWILQGGVAPPAATAALEPWDRQLAQLAREILRRRREAVALLAGELGRLCPELLGAPRVGVAYRSSLEGRETEEEILAGLRERQGEERRRRQCLVGPHRDDLLVELDGRDARRFGSRGQQRMLALALRLAEIRPVAAALGTPPVLLLDDALSELDPEAQARALREIEGVGQAFVTTADAGVPPWKATWWSVRGERVSKLAREPVRGVA